LTLSRLEAGLSSGEREDVDFAQLVKETAADSNFEAQASGKSVTFRTRGSVVLVNADPHALRSACENVIRNAVRFTEPGTNVEVDLEIDRSAPNLWHFSPFGTMVRVFLKILCGQSSSLSSE
jgi:two-component system sensor histidine kinase CpxA